jgi:hypothetical protein
MERKQALYFDWMEFQAKVFGPQCKTLSAQETQRVQTETGDFMKRWSYSAFLVASDEVVHTWHSV